MNYANQYATKHANNITPFEQAAAIYQQEPCANLFIDDLEFYFQNGTVISSPSFFVMFRPVASKADDSEIIGHTVFEIVDCWHVALFAGDLTKLKDCFPFALYFGSFEKRNVLKRYRFNVFFDQINKLIPNEKKIR